MHDWGTGALEHERTSVRKCLTGSFKVPLRKKEKKNHLSIRESRQNRSLSTILQRSKTRWRNLPLLD